MLTRGTRINVSMTIARQFYKHGKPSLSSNTSVIAVSVLTKDGTSRTAQITRSMPLYEVPSESSNIGSAMEK